ncbi:LacI family DNA-binding transcriptional regulator [Steroidobacter sp.]|uniref:LacI family DNA-binding transcriptional regulator n=1 Tax=Steroidobacter sp. TaxID=1978227 RepID=UPI001A577AC7|nr:LacI family DNA-binding transcriptional regulator [Steroidobacter sp.]MBL8268340.1 LacI family DNA-binding transcriptional regulator [Steroidobacter sp.]
MTEQSSANVFNDDYAQRRVSIAPAAIEEDNLSPKTRKPTSLDIAELANVSQATVSRALRGSPLVNAETRERVLEIARKLHYRTDRSAAGLRSRRSGTLALLLFEESRDEAQINSFFLSMLGHITHCAARRGFDLLLSFQQLSDDWHTDYEVSNRADGLILLGYGDYLEYLQRLSRFAEFSTHFVVWGPVIEGRPGHFVSCDNELGARLAVEHLLRLGRRSIAFIGSASDHSPEFQRRHWGYTQALRGAGLEPDARLHYEAKSLEAEGYRAGMALMDSQARFDAVFTASDLIATGVVRALQDRGLRVPEDVAVVGFDDIGPAAHFNPPLTTVRQDTRLAGELLVDNLIKLIEGRRVESRVIAPELVIRDSCGYRPTP